VDGAAIPQQLLNCKQIRPFFVYLEITNRMMTIIRQFVILLRSGLYAMDEHRLIFHHALLWQVETTL
jgi:hypothetical protein